LQRTLELIRKGTFASKGLPKSVNDFFAANGSLIKNPENFITELFKQVLDRYDLSGRSDEIKMEDSQIKGIINPKIVLTQSFI